MGRIELQIKAQLENLEWIEIPDSQDWHFKVRCSSCKEMHENVIYFNLVEKQDMPNSRG